MCMCVYVCERGGCSHGCTGHEQEMESFEKSEWYILNMAAAEGSPIYCLISALHTIHHENVW